MHTPLPFARPFATTRTTATTHCNYPRSHREIKWEREREYTQWGANGPGIVPVTGLRTRRDLAGKSDRPTDPIKLPTAFSGFCTHSYAHTLTFSLSFSFYSLPALPFLFSVLFFIFCTWQRASIQLHVSILRNSFNLIIGLTAFLTVLQLVERTHCALALARPWTQTETDPLRKPFLVLQRAHVHFGALFP